MTQFIALLTDFGLQDSFVGVMKGVMLGLAPQAMVVDITHEIPSQNIRAGAYQLMISYPYFPKGALFVAVVDPGVGSDRRIIYAEAGGWKFLAPDNGILSWVFKETPPQKIINVTESKYFLEKVSSTFHGRDIFAPVAARLISGLDPEKLGSEIKDYVRLPFPEVSKVAAKKKWKVEGEILAIDKFGNLITNIKTTDLPDDRVKIHIKGRSVKWAFRLYNSYAEASQSKKHLVAIAGSSGFIEISSPFDSAALVCHARASDKVKCYPQ